MTELDRLEALAERAAKKPTEIANSRDIWTVLEALPDLIRVARAARAMTFDLDVEARRLVLVGGFEELQEALAPLYREVEQ